MSIAPRFGAYAAAFERAVAEDDWSLIEPFFTEDAVYEVNGGPPLGGRAEGRADVVAKLRRGVEDLDRRFDTRVVEMVGDPEITASRFSMRWRATYGKAGCPDFVIDGSERADFEGELIRHLEDRVEDGTDVRFAAYAARHLTD